jgi:hypothetical protein
MSAASASFSVFVEETVGVEEEEGEEECARGFFVFSSAVSEAWGSSLLCDRFPFWREEEEGVEEEEEAAGAGVREDEEEEEAEEEVEEEVAGLPLLLSSREVIARVISSPVMFVRRESLTVEATVPISWRMRRRAAVARSLFTTAA